MPSHDLSRLASFFELLEVCLEPFKMANKSNSAVLWAMGKLTHSECLTHLFICLQLAITSFSLYFQLIHYLPINSVKASSIAPDVSPTFFSKPPCLNVPIKYVVEAIFLRKVLNLSSSLCLSDVNVAFFDCEGSFVVSLSLLSLFFLEHMFLIVYWRVSSVAPAISQCNAPRSPA